MFFVITWQLTLVFILALSSLMASTFALPKRPRGNRQTDGGAKPHDPPLYDSKVRKDEKPQILKLSGNNGNWFIIKQLLSFAEAEHACTEENGHLAVLPSVELMNMLVQSIKKISSPAAVIEDPENFKDPKKMEFGMSRRYWIGLTDFVEEGKWMWTIVGKELDFDFWYPGQPDHNGEKPVTKGEHCTTLWNPGYFGKEGNTHMFNDDQCTKKYYAICDKTPKLESLFSR